MTDVTQFIPQESKTVAAIYAHYKAVGDAEQPRGYLGASIIGHPCSRYLWYAFRACCRPEFSGRMYRLFETGDLEEARFVKDLRAIGCTVHEVEDFRMQGIPGYYIQKPKQFEVSALGGHFAGHLDAAILGLPEAPKTWHVGEFKTHCSKSFTRLKKKGVKVSEPQHYAQMMVYMHLTGMKRAFYLARNKDTDELYAERVRYNKSEAKVLMDRAELIITSAIPPARISEREDWYECTYCDAHTICWGSPVSSLPIPEVNCRQCCHATPTMDGKARWICEHHNRGLSESDQACACEDHLVLPGLIRFEPTDYGKDQNGKGYIEFICQNGDKFRHGRTEGAYSTKELKALPASMLVSQIVKTAKELFSAEATGHCPDDILHRYPESDSRIVWRGALKELPEAWLDRYKEVFDSLAPICTCDAHEYKAAEFDSGRVVVVWGVNQLGSKIQCEIREGIK